MGPGYQGAVGGELSEKLKVCFKFVSRREVEGGTGTIIDLSFHCISIFVVLPLHWIIMIYNIS